jgi:hypothetical protein
VVGHGRADFYGEFTIDAHSGPRGESPSGTFSARGAVPLDGPVTCLGVKKNVAVVNVQTSQYGLVTLSLSDGAINSTPDAIDGYPTEREPTDCSPFAGGATGNVVTGDIAVVDAQPR